MKKQNYSCFGLHEILISNICFLIITFLPLKKKKGEFLKAIKTCPQSRGIPTSSPISNTYVTTNIYGSYMYFPHVYTMKYRICNAHMLFHYVHVLDVLYFKFLVGSLRQIYVLILIFTPFHKDRVPMNLYCQVVVDKYTHTFMSVR